MKTPKSLLVGAALLSLLLCACGNDADTAQSVKSAPEPIIQSSTPDGYKSMPVYLDSLLALRGCKRADNTYLPVVTLAKRLGFESELSGTRKEFELKLDNITVTGESDNSYIVADGRYLYTPSGWVMAERELYLPTDAVCKIFNITADYSDRPYRMDISYRDASLISGGEDYYELNIPADDLYWLSHIITSESKLEPLEGQIGVGNVVMNRVESDMYPDSILEVVFDTKYAIQFEPISDGGIQMDVTDQAMIATYLCFEGANTVGDSLFFVNPKAGVSWFDKSLELTKVIGDHRFYRYIEKQ